MGNSHICKDTRAKILICPSWCMSLKERPHKFGCLFGPLIIGNGGIGYPNPKGMGDDGLLGLLTFVNQLRLRFARQPSTGAVRGAVRGAGKAQGAENALGILPTTMVHGQYVRCMRKAYKVVQEQCYFVWWFQHRESLGFGTTGSNYDV